MILHDADADKAFTELFDCRFPYHDPSASALIRQGWQTSLNAAFCVLNELCRPPQNSDVAKERLRELVTEWASDRDHPLTAPMLDAAHALIDGVPVLWSEGVELMKRVGNYEGQRAALAIAYFASDCDSPEGDDALNRTDAEIRQRWDANGV